MSATDKFKGPDIKPGSEVIYKRGDDEFSAVIESVTYTSASPAIYAELNRWQKARRALTPRRWRKPIPVIREARGPEIQINVVDSLRQVRQQVQLMEWLPKRPDS
ncbi:hypothetical protein SEA_EJIMIX_121 [Mycobacterium phage Ejimix]|nr:hypothetical protein SEA_EJIMIX_121 [Mycobacterium phage Ejimix]